VSRPRLVIEGFAGPGGWSEGLRRAGYDGMAVGFEHDLAACRTATAAGHLRVRADVASYPLQHLAGKVDGIIQSPPCQAFSAAGNRLGEVDQPLVFERIAAFAADRTPLEREWADARSMLTAEPMRWAVALRPRWIALEQVKEVLPLWRYTAELLRRHGYQTWTGILSTEQYGVPQTRKRAILIARRGGLPVGPPTPTHQPYRAGVASVSEPDLFGGLLPPPVSMATALGWGLDDRPAWTVTSGGAETGGAEVFGNAKNRRHLAEVVLRNGNQDNACERRACEPAGTLFFGARTNAVDWRMYPAGLTGSYEYSRSVSEPSPTIKGAGSGGQYVADDVQSSRITVHEAAILQSFPPDYPWQGTKSQQYQQVGNAVPPLLAEAILRPLIEQVSERAA
jgi:DNA (cytosine-5)-methyltransferase 1